MLPRVALMRPLHPRRGVRPMQPVARRDRTGAGHHRPDWYRPLPARCGGRGAGGAARGGGGGGGGCAARGGGGGGEGGGAMLTLIPSRRQNGKPPGTPPVFGGSRA